MTRTSTILTMPKFEAFEKRIKEVQIGACRLLMLRSEVKNIVSWKGSFVSNPNFSESEELIQSLVVSLLDKGTHARDKFQIADVLENKGANIRFSQRGLRVGFSGQSLRDDFDDVFGVLAEQLFTPKMAEDEFEKSKMRIGASIQRSMEQTGAQASLALSQLIYPLKHPNYTFGSQHELEKLQEVGLNQLHDYHANHFGSNDCILVVVGDFDESLVEKTVEKHFDAWENHKSRPQYEANFERKTPQSVHVSMPDKANLDVLLGQQVDIRRTDPDFTALYLGNFILGGNFSSRLMDVIRDEMGLTYGVHSGIIGVSKEHNGHWQISITLSQDKLEEGIEATRDLVTKFVGEGVTVDEVEEKKTTITGTYKVQMGTTHGLASTILRSLERGFEKDRLDSFSDEVAATTVEDVNRALQKYLDPAGLHLASAGTMAE